MATTTLADLRTRVRRLADVENAVDRFPVQEIDDYINDGLALWHRELITVWANWFLASVTTTVAAGSNIIPLPDDFHSLARLQLQDSAAPSGWRQVIPVSLDEMEDFAFSVGGRRGYMLIDAAVFLYPEAASSGTYRLWYHKRFAPLTDAADLVLEIDDWLRLAVLDAAINVKRKDEDDANDLVGERERLEEKVRAAAMARDAGSATHTLNVQDDPSPWPGMFR